MLDIDLRGGVIQIEEPDRNPALERLDALVGEWSIEAGPPGGPPWPGEGRFTGNFSDDGNTITGR